MSSFVHTPAVVSFIANVIADNVPYIFDGAYDTAKGFDADRLAHDLMAVNTEAVNNRYRENDSAPDFVFVRKPGLSKIQGLKYLESLVYQICDCYDMESQMGRWLEDAKLALALKIVSKLPEYEMAKWS